MFEQVLIQMSMELREITSRQPSSQHQNSNNQARHWRRRQTRQRASQNNTTNRDRRTWDNEEQRGHRVHQGRVNNQQNDRSQNNRTSGRQRWIREAQKLQGAYRRNAKRCVAQVTGEEKPRENCPIPMDTLTKWMANANIPPPGEKPPWIEEPSGNTEDALSASFSPREVVDQLRRLPGKSAPGPDRITYWQWKQLDGQGKLLSSNFQNLQEVDTSATTMEGEHHHTDIQR